ncbi:DUF4179 domain-containing protein [Cohnella zeiphila]|uniref:DUF4179 domain-containing protein n=1 Tax=Cohnella zeiphila TaxID=2761120 RepID=A0A7X0SM32_9BACL|nr:DUF4179 domain-containing protein [Cohnella zeiphila]MBB6732527.1 DUF4179 domain-containing protein [Cohnella zeiphila]
MHDRNEAEAALEARIGEAVAEGIRKGRQAARENRKARRIRYSALAGACVLLAACLFSIRISPAFASMLREIPGLEKFVDLIGSGDRGLLEAVDNDFVQPVGLSDEHDGRSLTVQGFIVDEMRMVIFYEISGDQDDGSLRIESPSLEDENGNDIKAMYSYGNYYGDQEKAVKEHGRYVVRGTVDVWLQDGLNWPDEATLIVHSGRADREGETKSMPEPPNAAVGDEDPTIAVPDDGVPEYRVRFPIDKTRFADMKREYPIARTLDVEGQKITFDRAVVTPLRIALYLDFAADNAMQVFDPGDIRIVDDKGNEWYSKGGWSPADQSILYFESNYFRQPKELYVEGSWFRALDKSKMSIVVDTEKEQILKAPDDKLTLTAVNRTGSYTKLTFKLTGFSEDDRMGYSLVQSQFTDASGKSYDVAALPSGVTFEPGEHKQYSYFSLNNNGYKQPLTFQIINYPNYIREPYRVRIY